MYAKILSDIRLDGSCPVINEQYWASKRKHADISLCEGAFSCEEIYTGST